MYWYKMACYNAKTKTVKRSDVQGNLILAVDSQIATPRYNNIHSNMRLWVNNFQQEITWHAITAHSQLADLQATLEAYFASVRFVPQRVCRVGDVSLLSLSVWKAFLSASI